MGVRTNRLIPRISSLEGRRPERAAGTQSLFFPAKVSLGPGRLMDRLGMRGFFCQFSAVELRDFGEFESLSAYTEGVVIFAEQQACRGIYLVCEGEVKLTVTSRTGKNLLLKIAKPGEVLGLQSALSGEAYESTAEALHSCRIGFISASRLNRFLQRNPAALLHVAHELGAEYRAACEQLSTIALGTAVTERLARFLLNLSANRDAVPDGSPFPLRLNHEEVGEYIGVARETVTRTLAILRKKKLIETRGSNVIIPRRAALEAFIAAEPCPHAVKASLSQSIPVKRPGPSKFQKQWPNNTWSAPRIA